MRNPKFTIASLCVWGAICWLGGGTATVCAQAQEMQTPPQKTQWTLRECLEYAERNNLQVVGSRLDVQANEAQLAQSRAALYPSINGQGTQNFQFGRSADPFTNTFINQQIRTNNFGINASLPLFEGFQNRTLVRVRRAETEASRADVEDVTYDVLLNVTAAYLQILLSEELLAQAQAQADNSREQLTRTERLVQAGSLPDASRLELVSQRATDELGIINAENQLLLAKLNLQQILQLPFRDDFAIVRPELDEPTEGALMPAAQVYGLALQTQPQIRAADWRVKAGVLGIKAARGGYYPRLTLNGNLFTGYSSARTRRLQSPGSGGQTNFILIQTSEGLLPVPSSLFESGQTGVAGIESIPFGEQLRDNFSQVVGATLTIPILNGYQIRTNVATASINAQRAQNQAQLVRNNLRQDVEQAHADARAAAKRYGATRQQVDALRENFRVAEQQFNRGAINAVDYALVRNNLIGAESSLAEAKYDYIFKAKVLDFYEGKPLNLE